MPQAETIGRKSGELVYQNMRLNTNLVVMRKNKIEIPWFKACIFLSVTMK